MIPIVNTAPPQKLAISKSELGGPAMVVGLVTTVDSLLLVLIGVVALARRGELRHDGHIIAIARPRTKQRFILKFNLTSTYPENQQIIKSLCNLGISNNEFIWNINVYNMSICVCYGNPLLVELA